MANESYDWRYTSLGGAVRVKVENGEDIAHLPELDEKKWTVLSCPVTGLETDQTTLKMIDSDGDGKIRVDEVKATVKWLSGVLKNLDVLTERSEVLSLDAIDDSNAEGAALKASAKQILANLGLEKNEISLSETSDSVKIFATTRFNGDGVITPASTDDEAQKAAIESIIAVTGGTADRSGVQGVTAEQIESYYAALADYAAWKEAGEQTALPYAENTEAALAACEAVKAKIADYFLRCKLISFDEAAQGALDVSVDKISAISGGDLTACGSEIASYPIARPGKDAALPVAEGINPAWQAAMASVKALVLDVDYPGKASISEAEWNAVLAKFAAYTAWKSAKKGDAVEALGLDAVKAALAADLKAALLEIVAQDKALEPEANAIAAVDKLLHLNRYFFEFLSNYVAFSDFYSGKKAVFQAGKLYIDQRCCELCINVADMGKHADMAGLSGMYIIYCNCVSKVKGKTMTIAAVLSNGDVENLRVGMNAIFYDRSGLDYDATVTKIVDNPVSIRQAFLAPYKKLARTITDRINKSAADKNNKVNADLTNKANTATIPANKDEAAAKAAAPTQGFDIAKFAGIFAAIGMALGMIGSAIMAIIQPWYNVLILLAVLVICISGPSMFIAWQKLRKRNLGPVLNANGWAINAAAYVNIVFGAKLTSIASYPRLDLVDPSAMKKKKAAKRTRTIIITAVVAIVAAAAALFFTDNLTCIGLPFHKAEPVAEEVVEAPVEAPAEVPAETAADAPAAE